MPRIDSRAVCRPGRSVRAGRAAGRGGEFTRRAFLNGKMGLSEAEAVHDLITARTAEAAQNAAAQVMGAVGSPVQQMRDELLGMVAHFHAVVDFPDETLIRCCSRTPQRCCTARQAVCTAWQKAMSAAVFLEKAYRALSSEGRTPVSPHC